MTNTHGTGSILSIRQTRIIDPSLQTEPVRLPVCVVGRVHRAVIRPHRPRQGQARSIGRSGCAGEVLGVEGHGEVGRVAGAHARDVGWGGRERSDLRREVRHRDHRAGHDADILNEALEVPRGIV